MTLQHFPTVNGYEIRERVGAGGFGVVYRAWQPSVQREVAIKVIHPKHANQPDFIRRFEVEAQIIARLENPHIVPLYDYWRDPDGAYLIMRWLRGNLRDSMARGAWKLDAAARLLDQLAAALAMAHREGIVHRDIKPENILLDEDENAYLADFGIAKDTQLQRTAADEGEFLGSPVYTSPEQIRSEEVNGRSDIYSLGYVLYELLAGHAPFPDAKTPSDHIQNHLTTPLPMMSIAHSNIPAAVDEVLQTATAKNPSHRYPTAARFAAAFRAAIPPAQPRIPAQPLTDALTERELEVLRLMMDGLSNSEIVDRLVLSPTTVKWYTRQIYSKLDVHSRQQAIDRALNLKLMQRQVISPIDRPVEVAALQVSENAVVPIDPDNPYKGLRAFQEADAADFFGRAALTERLLSRLSEGDESGRFLVIVGPSGSGKSSVVRAGLMPALRSGALSSSPHPFIADFLPGTHPLEELEAALLRVAVNPLPGLLDQLHGDRRGLVRAAKRVLPNDQQTELILVVDQFEEVFTLVKDEATRTYFIDNLLSAVTDPRGRVRVILTLRADFYDRPLLYPRLAELVRAHTEVIVPLTAREMEQAITAPAERIGMRLETGVVATILNDVGEQPGTLPLLQYALTELFEQREGLTLTLEGYEKTGGVLGALARRAQAIYRQLDDTGQQLARQLFLRLITLGEGTEDTRRRTLVSELAHVGKQGAMEEVIDTFAQYRLLTFDYDPLTHSPTVEIAHEALIREWGQLRDWLSASREDVRHQRRLAQAAAEWYAGGDTSFLASGSKLSQFETWAAETQLLLTTDERAYLDASLSESKRIEQVEQERQARERRLEQRSVRFLRALVAIFVLATVLSIGFASVALVLRGEAQRSSAEFRSIALTNGAQQALNDGQPDVALALSREAIRMDAPPELAQRMFFEAATSTWIRQRYVRHTSGVYDAVFLPDGQRMITVGWDGQAILWDVATGEPLQSIEHEGRLSKVAVHPNGHAAVIGGGAGLALLWDLDTNVVREFTSGEEWETSPVFNRDGTLLLTGTNSGRINVWDGLTLELIRSFKAHDDQIASINFNHDESLLITASWDGRVRVWDFQASELLQTLGHPGNWAWQGLFLPDDEQVITGDTGGNIYLWDWRSGEKIWAAKNPSDVQDIDLSPDARYFVTGSNDDTKAVYLWDTATGRLIDAYEGHRLRVQRVDISPDGRWILSASNDGTAILWPVAWEGTQRIISLPPGGGEVALHPSLSVAAVAITNGTGESDGAIWFLNTGTGAVVQKMEGVASGTDVVKFSPDGTNLILGSIVADGFEAQLWDWEAGEQRHVLAEHFSDLMDADFSLDGRIVAIGEGIGRRIILWDLETDTLIHILEGHHDWVSAVVFSPDGKTLYSGGRDGSLLVWDVTSGEQIGAFAAHTNSLNDLDVNAEGTRLVSASSDGTAILWNTATYERMTMFSGHLGSVLSADFSPDSRYLLTGSADASLIVWDASTGERLWRYREHNPNSSELAIYGQFTSDGQSILSIGGDSMTFWDAMSVPNGLEAWVENSRYAPDFTCEQRDFYRIEPPCHESTTTPGSGGD